MKWEDATSYSRSDKERKPTCWRIYGGLMSVVVVFNHRDRPGEWCFHCPALAFDAELLYDVHTEQEAKEKALKVIELHLARMRDTLSSMQTVT
jgi:hypothetical protein